MSLRYQSSVLSSVHICYCFQRWSGFGELSTAYGRVIYIPIGFSSRTLILNVKTTMNGMNDDWIDLSVILAMRIHSMQCTVKLSKCVAFQSTAFRWRALNIHLMGQKALSHDGIFITASAEKCMVIFVEDNASSNIGWLANNWSSATTIGRRIYSSSYFECFLSFLSFSILLWYFDEAHFCLQ